MDFEHIRNRRNSRLKKIEEYKKYIIPLDELELAMIAWADSLSSLEDYNGWLKYQFCRVIGILRSIIILLTNGCVIDALSLNRIIQDIYILVNWVSLDPKLRLKIAMVDEVNKQRVYTAKRMEKLTSDLPQNLIEYAKKNNREMNGLPTIAKMAEEIGAEALYATAFNMSSAFLHNQGSELQFLASWNSKSTTDPLPNYEHFEMVWMLTYHITKDLWESFSDILDKDIKFEWNECSKIGDAFKAKMIPNEH